MAVFAFLRVSTEKQTLDNQQLEVLAWANRERISIDEFIQIQVSTRKQQLVDVVKAMTDRMQVGDMLIVTELSRIARSMQQLLVTVNTLVDRGITLVSIKENLRLSLANNKDLQSKVMVALFSILYEVERDMISERTKRGLERARADGKTLGRPKGAVVASKLDRHTEEIRVLVMAGCPYAVLGRKFGCHHQTVSHFVKSRRLDESVAIDCTPIEPRRKTETR